MPDSTLSRSTSLLLVLVLLAGIGLGAGAVFLFNTPTESATAGATPASTDTASAGSSATTSASGLARYDRDGDGTVYQGGMHPEVVQDEPGNCPICGMALTPTAVGEQAPEGTVRISPVTLQNIGVRTSTVQTEALERRVRTTGRFQVNERLTTAVAPKVGGWVDELHVDYDGARVREGQPLFDLYSPELVATQEEYLSALRSAERLGDAAADRLVEAARRRLAYWDISDAQVEKLKASRTPMRTLTFYAPAGGTVTDKSVTEGQKIAPGQTLMQITNLRSLWLMADVYEQDLSWINEGSAATISLPYDAGRTVEATVDYLYDEVDETTRTVKARLSVPNGDRSLRPGMYAVVEIRGAAAEPRPVVPQEAIVSSGDLDVVIVAEGDGRFRPTPVHTGRSASGQTQILHGLTGGERVVTSAQFLIDSEARLQGALTAMTESVDGESMSGGMDAAGMEMDASPDASAEMDHAEMDHAGASAESSGEAPDEASEPSHGTAHDHGSGAEATAEGPAHGDATDGRIEITVTEQGFQPSHVHVAQGVETELVFTRKTTSTCATNVQIPALGVDPVKLPMNEAVTIRVTPQKTGSFTFACGMDMIKGTLMIQQ